MAALIGAGAHGAPMLSGHTGGGGGLPYSRSGGAALARTGPVLVSSVVPSSDLPRVGVAFGETIRSCTASRVHGTPTTSEQCAAWAPSGPVNVVIVSHGAGPPGAPVSALLGATGAWRPALGGWLVASAESHLAGAGCQPGWRDSGQQVEQRIDPRTRRHFKFFTACGPPGTTIDFGEAHVDNFLLPGCGGDHMTDLDRARDEVAASYRSLPGVTVEYFRDHSAAARYPDGCGHWVSSDGQVAYIVMGG